MVTHSTINWTQTPGCLIGRYQQYYIQIKWLDKKDYSVWIFKGDKVLYTKNDDIKSYNMGQSLAVGQLQKIINNK